METLAKASWSQANNKTPKPKNKLTENSLCSVHLNSTNGKV